MKKSLCALFFASSVVALGCGQAADETSADNGDGADSEALSQSPTLASQLNLRHKTGADRTRIRSCRHQAWTQKEFTEQLTGVVSDYQTKQPISGARVCAEPVLHGATPPALQTCVTSDANGNYAVPLFSCWDSRVVFSEASHTTSNWLLRTETDDIQVSERLVTEGLVNLLAATVSQTPDPTKGLVTIPTYVGATLPRTPMAGVSVDISPASGSVFYLNASGIPQLSLTSTSSTGVAGVFNIEPGFYDVAFDAPGHTGCSPAPFVPGDAPNTARLEVLANGHANTWLVCSQ